MAKFKLGDFVKYSNKSMGMNGEWFGTIISCCPNNSEYIIKWDEDKSKSDVKWWVGSKDIHFPTSTYLIYEFAQKSLGSNYVRTLGKNNSRVSSNSRTLKLAEMKYDPTQMGDRDDDI
jgi:hypothetical protein